MSLARSPLAGLGCGLGASGICQGSLPLSNPGRSMLGLSSCRCSSGACSPSAFGHPHIVLRAVCCDVPPAGRCCLLTLRLWWWRMHRRYLACILSCVLAEGPACANSAGVSLCTHTKSLVGSTQQRHSPVLTTRAPHPPSLPAGRPLQGQPPGDRSALHPLLRRLPAGLLQRLAPGVPVSSPCVLWDSWLEPAGYHERTLAEGLCPAWPGLHSISTQASATGQNCYTH